MTQDQVSSILKSIPPQSDGIHIVVHTPSHSYKGYANQHEPIYGILRLDTLHLDTLHDTHTLFSYFIDIAQITIIEAATKAATNEDEDSN